MSISGGGQADPVRLPVFQERMMRFDPDQQILVLAPFVRMNAQIDKENANTSDSLLQYCRQSDFLCEGEGLA